MLIYLENAVKVMILFAIFKKEYYYDWNDNDPLYQH